MGPRQRFARQVLYETSAGYRGYEEFLGFRACGAGRVGSGLYGGRHVIRGLPPEGTVGAFEVAVGVGGLGIYGLTREAEADPITPDGSAK